MRDEINLCINREGFLFEKKKKKLWINIDCNDIIIYIFGIGVTFFTAFFLSSLGPLCGVYKFFEKHSQKGKITHCGKGIIECKKKNGYTNNHLKKNCCSEVEQLC